MLFFQFLRIEKLLDAKPHRLCQYCDRSFHPGYIKYHQESCRIRNVFITSEDERYNCGLLCGRSFKTHKGARSHITKVHIVKEKLQSTKILCESNYRTCDVLFRNSKWICIKCSKEFPEDFQHSLTVDHEEEIDVMNANEAHGDDDSSDANENESTESDYDQDNINDEKKIVQLDFMERFKRYKPDLNIIVDNDQVFECHQVMLARFSIVFEKVMSIGTSTKYAKEVKVSANPNSILELLRFCYTGMVEDSKMAFLAAKNYDVQEMMAVCKSKLFDDLTYQNVCEKLMEFKDDDGIKEHLMTYINNNFDQVSLTDGWK